MTSSAFCMKRFFVSFIQNHPSFPKEGILRPDVHFGYSSPCWNGSADMFIDLDFLLENGLKATRPLMRRYLLPSMAL